MQNALSIDIEEYFQVHAFESLVDKAAWGDYPSRVEASVRSILRILREASTKATFFVLGWVADHHPNLVREVASAGHEIATHGYRHELIYRQTPQEFAADLQRSLEAIDAALGREGGPESGRCNPRVLGYRAPAFSITKNSLWALDVLSDHGIRYDSSVFPLLAHDRYGIPNASRFSHRLTNGLWEVPVSTVRLLGRNWPVAGGGYFRLYPLPFTCWCIRRINAEGHPAVVYLHPWELDPDQPRIAGVDPFTRWRHFVNIDRMEDRLPRLIRLFDFGPIREVFGFE